jgi:hypothetical protein
MYDPATRDFVYLAGAALDRLDAATEVWTVTDTGWHQIETLHAPPAGISNDFDAAGPVAVYSPGRAATVLYRGADPDCAPPCGHLRDTWSFDGTDWVSLASPVPAAGSSDLLSATYDPVHQRVVLAIGSFDAAGSLWSLGDADDAWVPLDGLATGEVPNLTGLAWHARGAHLMAVLFGEDFIQAPFELRDGRWVAMDFFPALYNNTPRANALFSVPRTGGVLAIDGFAGLIWQYLGTTWTRLPSVPVQFDVLKSPAYNPVNGSVAITGVSESGTIAAVLSRSSPTPLESCVAGEDRDGDGLAGCADPDCYWACSRCAPYTTCP